MKAPASPVFYLALRDALEVAEGRGEVVDMVKITGITRSTLDRWRSGAGEVRPSHLRALAVRLGRSMVVGSYADGEPLVGIGRGQ